MRLSTIYSYENTFHLHSEPEKETLCSECFSMQTSNLAGVQLEEMTPHFIEVSGRDNKKHLFYIDRIVFPMGISLEATEIQEREPRGYKIAVRGDLDGDQAMLLEKLLNKVRKLVSRKYIEEEKTRWGIMHFIKEDEVVGRIEWDEQYEGRLPLVIIDGKEYSWEEFGEMMTSFEGWDFKLKIFDSWEDVD